ncbi:nitronate monooxygenase [Devosia sp. YIM 151766]|uniref:NAD(P)H-dependent flavin oxidoreductase n=1 Tax=Devosia sp. YIM 151766 TaxID=3017325 RepID=UPI00255C876F|nr:nitronate monooxygenase [Devosia sp. YIM 151766]WIY52231.1 nitronate monooxygenase [Devosia sp. YIM 151766]
MKDQIRNTLETLLGCRHPIISAGMGGVARSELVAAVTNAGGFGFLGMVREPVSLIGREVEALRQGGHRRFGVNIIPGATDSDLLARQLDAIIDLEVPAVCLFWEIDRAVIRRLRDAGIVVVYQVGSVDEALMAERAGSQIIIAQGQEAGGHVRGATPLRRLLPAIVKKVDIPVLAAGGLASGADLVIARALGAAGIVLGTALIATTESFAHSFHQQRLLAATAADTLLTDIFHINWPPGAMVRVLRSAVTAGRIDNPGAGAERPIGEEEGRPIYLFSTDSPLRTMTGDFASMALYAGTGVGSITEIKPAGTVIDDILEEAEALLTLPASPDSIERASPVCYADEVSNTYMGLLEEPAAAAETTALVHLLRAGLAASLAGMGESAEQPPFTKNGLFYARYISILRDFIDPGATIPDLADSAPHALPALLRQHLHTLLPQLAEGRRRSILLALAEELQADPQTG